MSKVFLIGIAGGTGSGKTTLAENIVTHFGESITLLCHDDYYKAHDDLPYSEREKLNYDHPDAFDTELLISHLEALKRGESIECPIYDYTVHNRSDRTKTIHPTPVILLEGILIFSSAVIS